MGDDGDVMPGLETQCSTSVLILIDGSSWIITPLFGPRTPLLVDLQIFSQANNMSLICFVVLRTKLHNWQAVFGAIIILGYSQTGISIMIQPP